MRSTPEWIGSTDDAAIPKRVRIRIFERYHGKCGLTGKVLLPGEWDADHIMSLEAGGQHRESNLWPVWRPKHREKTAAEAKVRKKVNDIKKKFQLPKAPGKIKSRGFGPWKSNTKYINQGDD